MLQEAFILLQHLFYFILHLRTALTRDRTVLPAIHTLSHPAFALYSQPQSIIALWPVLIHRCAEGKRLSWPGWLVTYRDGMPARWRSPFLVLTTLDVEQLRWYAQLGVTPLPLRQTASSAFPKLLAGFDGREKREKEKQMRVTSERDGSKKKKGEREEDKAKEE